MYAYGPEAPREGLFDEKRDRTAKRGVGLQKSTHLVFQQATGDNMYSVCV